MGRRRASWQRNAIVAAVMRSARVQVAAFAAIQTANRALKMLRQCRRIMGEDVVSSIDGGDGDDDLLCQPKISPLAAMIGGC